MENEEYLKMVKNGASVDELVEYDQKIRKERIRKEHHNYLKLDDTKTYEEKEENYLKQIEDEVTEEMIKIGLYYIKDGKVEKPNTMGACHKIWACQKRLLKEIFDFDWKTPSEKNPDIEYF